MIEDDIIPLHHKNKTAKIKQNITKDDPVVATNDPAIANTKVFI